MKALATRVMNEPAVALGLLGALVVLGFKLANHELISADDIVQVLAPLGVGLGTRQAVVPQRTLPEAEPESIDYGADLAATVPEAQAKEPPL